MNRLHRIAYEHSVGWYVETAAAPYLDDPEPLKPLTWVRATALSYPTMHEAITHAAGTVGLKLWIPLNDDHAFRQTE